MSGPTLNVCDDVGMSLKRRNLSCRPRLGISQQCHLREHPLPRLGLRVTFFKIPGQALPALQNDSRADLDRGRVWMLAMNLIACWPIARHHRGHLAGTYPIGAAP